LALRWHCVGAALALRRQIATVLLANVHGSARSERKRKRK
jgi:hypothetical protein